MKQQIANIPIVFIKSLGIIRVKTVATENKIKDLGSSSIKDNKAWIKAIPKPTPRAKKSIITIINIRQRY